MNFSDKLEAAIKEKKSCLLLGLDPKLEQLPEGISRDINGIIQFCKNIINATEKYITGIKIQMAYFEIFGSEGVKAVEILLGYAKEKGLITMVDGKRNDIGPTAEAYAKAYLEPDNPLECDCITVNPLLGTDSIQPFVKACEEHGKGIFVLVRTSNPSAVEFQGGESEVSLKIAEKIEEWNITTQSEKNNFASIGAVIGATIDPKFLAFFREEMPHAWFLCPGVGAQGGDMKVVLNVRRDGLGVLIPVSRSILYASNGTDYKEAAETEMKSLFEAQK